MRKLVSLVILGCALATAGLARLPRSRQGVAVNVVSARQRAPAKSTRATPSAAPMQTGEKIRTVPKFAQVHDTEFVLLKEDGECNCPTNLMKKQRALFESLFDYCKPYLKQPWSRWRGIQKATQTCCDAYVFVDYAKESPQDVCGALGFVAARSCDLPAKVQACAKKNGIREHSKPCKKSKKDKRGKKGKSCTHSVSEGHYESSSQSRPCSKSSSESKSDEVHCADVTCEWKHNDKCAVLCKKFECTECGEPTLLTFDDCPSETCDDIFPDEKGLDTTYRGFTITNGGVYNPWENRCNFANQCAYPSDIAAVISGEQILISSQPREPVVISRKKPFGLVSLFLTLSSIYDFTVLLDVTATYGGKDLCTEHVRLRSGCPVNWRPKNKGFLKVNKVKFEWDMSGTRLELTHLDIDNMLVCM